MFLYNTHIRWTPFLAHFRGNFNSLEITNYPGLIPFFQPGKLFRGQKCLSTNFRAKKTFFQKKFFFRKNVFQTFCKFFDIFFSKIPTPMNAPKNVWRLKTRKLMRPWIFRARPGEFSARLKISQKSQKFRNKFWARPLNFWAPETKAFISRVLRRICVYIGICGLRQLRFLRFLNILIFA